MSGVNRTGKNTVGGCLLSYRLTTCAVGYSLLSDNKFITSTF